jgi:hypothetical protein
MQTFELYGAAWLVYLSLGILLLALITYKIKNLSWHLKFGLISFIAVGAFTPDMIANTQTYAPLVISALLKAEVEGSSAIINGLIKLIIIWGIVFFSALSLKHFLQTRKKVKIES